MRVLEIALIFINIVSLFLCFGRRPRAVWLGAAGANLLAFMLHGVMDGFRYQMAFAYVFTGLFSVFALIQASGRLPKVRVPKALKAVMVSLCFVLLAFSATLAYALPVFTLAKPTGNYAVGVEYTHLVDEKRNDPFLDQSARKRELMVKIYYPAQPDSAKPFARYFHGDPKMIRAFAGFYQGLPPFLFDHLQLVKTNSKEGLALSGQQSSYPVILFSHGAGASMEVQTSQCEDLASHGYVVAAIDHPYVSAATAFPDRIVSSAEATTDFNTGDPAEFITQIMADDASFVIDQLEEMNAGTADSIFKGRLDLSKIGAIGHSVGGAVAYNLAIQDSRVRAAVNLDGRVYITPKGGAASMSPFLMLANDKYHIQSIQNRESLLVKFEDLPKEDQDIMVSMYGSKEAYQEAYQRSLEAAQGLAEVVQASGNLYTIEGSDHMKFTDIGLFFGVSQLREMLGIGGKTDPAKCLEVAEAASLAFFDQQLKGETAESLESLSQRYPQLQHVVLN